jgi:hypothetical protein
MSNTITKRRDCHWLDDDLEGALSDSQIISDGPGHRRLREAEASLRCHPSMTTELVMTTIDIHCHLATLASRAPVEPHRRPEYEPYEYFMGPDSATHNRAAVPNIMAPLTEPAARLEHMDRMGVDVQGLSTFVSEYFYWAPSKEGRVGPNQNDNLAAISLTWCSVGGDCPSPGRRPGHAEMDRQDDLGFKGLQIGGTNVQSRRATLPLVLGAGGQGIRRSSPERLSRVSVSVTPSGQLRFGNPWNDDCHQPDDLQRSVRRTSHGSGAAPQAATCPSLSGRPPGRCDPRQMSIPDHPPSHYIKMPTTTRWSSNPLPASPRQVVGVDHAWALTSFDMARRTRSA